MERPGGGKREKHLRAHTDPEAEGSRIPPQGLPSLPWDAGSPMPPAPRVSSWLVSEGLEQGTYKVWPCASQIHEAGPEGGREAI